ncbi:hypothetical protein [Streptomyces sp. NPDC050388]|uniref:hypothetical protein n=1 Tax=Streptomyces sp. NPDC050388 TaxID=3155781 RepID=UPI003425E7BE
MLIAAAAVLGVVAGTCTGYLVQADREPTALPSPAQPVLTQEKGQAPAPLSAAQDRRVKTDGDLRKLLLKKPRGAKDDEFLMGDDGWMRLADYASMFEDPDETFGELLADEFRRAAVTGWSKGDTSVEIRLVQYRQEEVPAAADYAEGAQYWTESEDGVDSWDIPGTGGGMAYVYTRPDSEPGYLPVYRAEAHAWRGDIHMEIWVTDTERISKKEILGLAERQMERL